MKKNTTHFIYFVLLLCIGLQYGKPSTIRTVRVRCGHGLMGVSIFLTLFYMIPALYFLFRIGKMGRTL